MADVYEEIPQSVMPTYARIPVAFVRGEGSYVYDSNGKRYLDGLTGIAVCGLGHAHPKVADAIARQASTLLHTSNLYRIPGQERLASRLCEISGMDNVFFCNSGAEANEATIKIARLYGHSRNCAMPHIVVADGSFHGRTMATLTATGNRKVQAGFEPLLAGFVRAPYNDVESVEKIAANNKNVVAVLVEPILGEGGIVIPDDGYLEALRGICDRHDWLLMLDEVQTGNGRTGKYFAFQHTSVMPDVVATAKGLGNGVPIGACLARGEAAKMLLAGTHGSTFGGNFLACAAANVVVDELTEGGVMDRAAELGERMLARFRDRLAGNNRVKEIRGKGLLVAVELNEPCTDLVGAAVDAGLLINVAADTVIRLLPPLTMSDDEADAMVDHVADLIDAMPGQTP
ncbi:MAG: aspartate aminotransferase family protein [Gammaproteobacteria bacterium]|nr:aspartate aminotransferase family protein [Gammaproteobacteria bacterium]